MTSPTNAAAPAGNRGGTRVYESAGDTTRVADGHTCPHCLDYYESGYASGITRGRELADIEESARWTMMRDLVMPHALAGIDVAAGKRAPSPGVAE